MKKSGLNSLESDLFFGNIDYSENCVLCKRFIPLIAYFYVSKKSGRKSRKAKDIASKVFHEKRGNPVDFRSLVHLGILEKSDSNNFPHYWLSKDHDSLGEIACDFLLKNKPFEFPWLYK